MKFDNLIQNKQILKEFIESEKKSCIGNKSVSLEMRYRRGFNYRVFCYLKLLRKMEYLCYRRDTAVQVVLEKFYSLQVKKLDRRKNKLGIELGLDIPINHVQKGVRIAHPNVILNGFVGENCIFHGNNVLGNKRTGAADEVPYLGNNVDVGVGAIIIGNAKIADNCIIGAGAVVTRSFETPGTVIVGAPAKEMFL